MSKVEITKEPVELYKILKFEGIADSGGQAKAMIDAGLVFVNGTVELQKRKKILSGDVLTIENNSFEICLAQS